MKIAEIFMRILRHVNNHRHIHTIHTIQSYSDCRNRNIISRCAILWCFQIQIMQYYKYTISLIFSFGIFDWIENESQIYKPPYKYSTWRSFRENTFRFEVVLLYRLLRWGPWELMYIRKNRNKRVQNTPKHVNEWIWLRKENRWKYEIDT